MCLVPLGGPDTLLFFSREKYIFAKYQMAPNLGWVRNFRAFLQMGLPILNMEVVWSLVHLSSVNVQLCMSQVSLDFSLASFDKSLLLSNLLTIMLIISKVDPSLVRVSHANFYMFLLNLLYS